MKTNYFVSGLLVLIICVCGCGQKLPDGMPKLRPCSVTIVQAGQPLADATVDLILKEGNAKWSVSGMTDATGRVECITHGLYKGAPEGTYKVVVTKRENGTKDAKGYLPIYSVVDKKYTDPSTTPLEIVVDAKGCDEKLDAGTPVKIQVDRLEPTIEPKG
ncbi:MAG: hypothetical protein Q4G59_02780 [Planctomycetia bacterium]|nr:hypothetical protein [Planctomycetia bacterium]